MSRTSWRPGRPEFTHRQKRIILARDRTCVACGVNPSTIADHRTPTAEGGANTLDNGQGMCTGCHNTKTRAEMARGRARQPTPNRRRQVEPHPGLMR